jgi:polysaccharide pyruvyl transferase WcaK-like protein
MNPAIDWARRGKQQIRLARDAWRLRRWRQRAGRVRRQPDGGGRALIIASGGVGSIGDEAMLIAAASTARNHGIASATLVSFGKDKPWPLLPGYDRVLDLSSRFLTDFWDTCPDWLEALGDATHFLIIGADIMDGHYSPNQCRRRVAMAHLAEAAGVRTTILGFSFNDSPHPLAVAALDSLPATIKINARDAISMERLSRALTRPVDLSADIAFQLIPAERSDLMDAVLPWIDEQQSSGRLVIGINANFLAAPAAMRCDGGQPLIDAYASELAAFAADGPDLAYLLVPHDYRSVSGLPNDQQVAESIARALPEPLQQRTSVVPAPAKAPEIKAIAGRLDLVVTGRMHLAIAAIGGGTPAGGVVYQDKFEGLYRHLDLPPLCFDPARLSEHGAFADFLAHLVERREEFAATIRTSLPRVHALADGNLAAGGPAIEGGHP